MSVRRLCTEITTPDGVLRCAGSYEVLGIEDVLIREDHALYPIEGVNGLQLQGRCEERRGLFFMYHSKLIVPPALLQNPRAKLIVTVFPDFGEYPKCPGSLLESPGSQRSIPVWKAKQYNGMIPLSRNPAPIMAGGDIEGVRISDIDQVRLAYNKRGWVSFGDSIQVVLKDGRSSIELFEPTLVHTIADMQWRRLHEIYNREMIIEKSVKRKFAGVPDVLKAQEMQTVPHICPSRGKRYSLYRADVLGDH